MNEYIEMWKHYADFSGTTTVRGYWMAFLFNYLAALVLAVLTQFVSFFALLAAIYSLAAIIPGIAICVRRLRDAGKSWANIFWSFLPVAGVIVLIVMLCAPSKQAQN